MRDTPETRAATTARVGPWYLLQPKNPASPGMNFSTLLSLVRRGRVTPTSVVRGPTTQQLWAMASRVKGLSREFGVCYACGGQLERASNLCAHCQRLQDPPMNPDALLEHKATGAPAAAPARPPHRPRQAPPVAGSPAAAAAVPDVGLPPGTLATTLPGSGAAKGRILTPRELAAAFALDAPGEGGTAAAPAASAPEERRRGHPVRKVLLTAVLFAIAAFGVYLVVDPEFREVVRARLVWAGDWARTHISSPTSSAKPVRPAPVAAPANVGTPVKASHQEGPAATVVPPVPAVSRPPPQAAPATTKSAAAAAAVRVDVGPPVETGAAVSKVVVSKSRQAGVKVEPEGKGTAAAATPEVVAKSVELFRQALEAESDGDYATAVKRYEEIKGLPREAWPATLERRLAAARGRVGEG